MPPTIQPVPSLSVSVARDILQLLLLLTTLAYKTSYTPTSLGIGMLPSSQLRDVGKITLPPGTSILTWPTSLKAYIVSGTLTWSPSSYPSPSRHNLLRLLTSTTPKTISSSKTTTPITRLLMNTLIRPIPIPVMRRIRMLPTLLTLLVSK